MKIVIALTSAADQISGVQRHAINLARCLLTREEVTAVHLIVASWQQQCLRSVEPIRDARLHLHTAHLSNTSIGRNLWYYTKLPRIAAELKADIVHLAYPMPIRRHMYGCPTVLTLHDLYPYDAPGNFGFPKVLFNEAILHQCLQAADAITCVSHSTRHRLETIGPQLARSKATVVFNCVEPQNHVSDRGPVPGWTGEPFLLCVAQHRQNKNLLLLLRVFRTLLLTNRLRAGARLVIIGVHGPQTKPMQRFLTLNQLQDRVSLLNGLSDEEVQWCYRNCNLLIAPSVVEGFGLPVAEALLAGCHVVCSDIPAFREVGGDRCEYIRLDKNAEQAFAEAVSTVSHRPRPEPVALPHLSATHIAEQYLQLYRSLLRPAPSPDTLVFEPTASSQGEIACYEKR
jgi:glycosyltransferase involved in cell wall biosynthesis